MNRKTCIILIICIAIIVGILQKSYAKYVINKTLQIKVYIDKTPPKIDIMFYKKGEKILNFECEKNSCNEKNFFTELELNIENNIEENEQVNENVKDEKNQIENIENSICENLVEKVDIENSSKNEDVIENTIQSDKEKNDFKINESEVNDVIIEENEQVNENVLNECNINNSIMLFSIPEMYVGNEEEFRRALQYQASNIYVRQSINFSSSIYINYPVTITGVSADNALRYGNSGSFIIVGKNGSLGINGMVIDTNSFGVGGICTINIQEGGTVSFINSSIVDSGLSNTGILVNKNAILNLYSCEIVRGGYGINLQQNGNINFLSQEGRKNNFWWNSIAIFIDNFYGNVEFNDTVCMHDNSNSGIYVSNANGEIKITGGNYYNVQHGVHTCNISEQCVKIIGGHFYNNTYCLWLGGNIELTGGIIDGEIYLADNDNYINTNQSYPLISVTPSSYYVGRKIVKSINNENANREINNINFKPNDVWYLYIEKDSSYIVLSNNGNVIVKCKDYYGNIIKEDIIVGSINSEYNINIPQIEDYDFIKAPANLNGKFSKNDILLELKYDLVNMVQVNYEDLISGVEFAKYWYNEKENIFYGEGNIFENGEIFNKYGYYKILVENKFGVQNEKYFILNKDSISR